MKYNSEVARSQTTEGFKDNYQHLFMMSRTTAEASKLHLLLSIDLQLRLHNWIRQFWKFHVNKMYSYIDIFAQEKDLSSCIFAY